MVEKKTEENQPSTDKSQLIRIYCDGIFDLFHFGHARLFRNCKSNFENVEMVVGTTSDEETLKLKGKQVMNQYERQETIKQCKWVDEVICPCPWIVSVVILNFKVAIFEGA